MRVAILGMGPSADAFARHAGGAGNARKVFDEVWTVNAFGSVFKVDRVFHMDDIRIQKIRAKAGNVQIGNLLDWLRDAPGPIYTSRTLPAEPNSLLEETTKALLALGETDPEAEVARLEGMLRWLEAERELQMSGGFKGLVEYPLCDVLMGAGGPPYFTNTVPYAIALALAGKKAGLPEDVDTIALFGVDYSYTNHGKAERGRACCEYWLGRCFERGIGVHLPAETWIMDCNRKDRLYGYDTQLVNFNIDESGTLNARLADKPCPTAEEIEAVYAH